MPARVLFIDMWPEPERQPRGALQDRFRDIPGSAAADGCAIEAINHADLAPDEWSRQPPAAVMLSGSRLNLVDDPAEDPANGAPLSRFAAVAELLERLPRVPVIGICFGHQYLAKAAGGTLAKMPERRGHDDFQIQPLEADPLLAGLPERPSFVESHLWRVATPGRGYRVVATSPDGIEMVRHAELPRLGVQFHPEYFARQPAARAHGRIFLANWFRSISTPGAEDRA